MYSDFALIDTPLTVSEINTLIKKTFEERFFNLCVTGEISSFRPSGNGHWYFTLKDSQSQLAAVMFRSMQYKLEFRPKDGDLVTVTGNIDVYAPRGTYQIICQSMVKAGEGALLAEIEKRKARYESMGYFDLKDKKPIPRTPSRIGVVTASTGAAIQDILKATGERAPSVDITLYETLVQGSNASQMIANAIDMANADGTCDVLIVGRGGGSIEDLLPFSEEPVIEAIHRSRIPVISAVGHEIDWSISDYVADQRAITPTEGAVIATAGIFEIRKQLHQLKDELSSVMEKRILIARQSIPSTSELVQIMKTRSRIALPSQEDLKLTLMRRIDSCTMRLGFASDGIAEAVMATVKDRESRIANARKEALSALPGLYSARVQSLRFVTAAIRARSEESTLRLQHRIELLEKEAMSAIRDKLQRRETLLSSLSGSLEALNPQDVLSRGYAIVFNEEHRVIRSSNEVKAGDRLEIHLGKGIVKAHAEGDGK